MPGSDNQSAFYLLSDNADALIARLALVALARETVDIQYYIIHSDASGQLLAHHLIEAADRGVRVRILVDDINLAGKDIRLNMFNAHPNIELRIFNPLINRGIFRNLELVLRVNRAGRRMHNKAFIMDNSAAIIGGRNIGDEYFDDRTQLNFVDLDLLSVGPVVNEISKSFNDYWNSNWAIPVNEISKTRIAAKQFISFKKKLRDAWSESANSEYFKTISHAGFSKRLIEKKLPFVMADAELFYDRPEKIAGKPGTTHVGPSIVPYVDASEDQILVTSPYFIPGKDGISMFQQLRQKKIDVQVLTNSLAATDVFAVHAGYEKYRPALLRCGTKLFELKPTARPNRIFKKYFRSSSQASLHAKYLVIDKKEVFIGSANFDPRSRNLNTEIGMVIHSEELANQVIDLFTKSTDLENSYKIVLTNDENGKQRLFWHTRNESLPVTYQKEPHTSLARRIGAFLVSLLPVESLL